MEAKLPTKEELVNEVKVAIEAYYTEVLNKLEKRAEEIKNQMKRRIDQELSRVKLEQ